MVFESNTELQSDQRLSVEFSATSPDFILQLMGVGVMHRDTQAHNVPAVDYKQTVNYRPCSVAFDSRSLCALLICPVGSSY